jgi:LNR domain
MVCNFGAILLIVVAITTVLAVTLPQDPSNCGKDGYFGPNCDLYYPNCSVMNPELIGNGLCDPDEFYTEECGWDGGDCIGCKDGYFGRHCDLEYPNCSGVDPLLVQYPMALGAGICEGQPFNTEECGWDGGDCIRCNDGYFGPYCDLDYPNCSIPDPAWIGDSGCDGLPYNVEECGWDGGDCCAPGYFGRNCEVTGYPNCSAAIPNWIGDGECDEEGNYNTTECGWDGRDCL